MMDMTLIRSVFTVLMFVIFLGICWWAYSSRNKKKFDEYARMALEDEDANTNKKSTE